MKRRLRLRDPKKEDWLANYRCYINLAEVTGNCALVQVFTHDQLAYPGVPEVPTCGGYISSDTESEESDSDSEEIINFY